MSEQNEGFSMIVPVMAISNLVLTQQIHSDETNGAHAHNCDRVPLMFMNEHRLCFTAVPDKVILSILRLLFAEPVLLRLPILIVLRS